MAGRCTQEDIIIRYVADELSEEETSIVEKHASTCAKCTSLLIKLLDDDSGEDDGIIEI